MQACDLSIMQWVASTALTLASLTIALVAATFGYRQNYGWKPAILVLKHGFGGGDVHIAYVDFEVWNRRKYPIVIHSIEIKFGTVELEHRDDKSGWYIFHNILCTRLHMSLDPASHRLFKSRVPFRHQKVENETIRIDVYYFDPIANTRKKLTTKHRFKYTDEPD